MNLSRICVVFLFGALLALVTGCENDDETQQSSQSPQVSQAEQIQYTSTVVNKSIKSDKFLVEISGQDIHEIIEVPPILWDQIKVNDTVGLNDSKELISINNVPIE